MITHAPTPADAPQMSRVGRSLHSTEPGQHYSRWSSRTAELVLTNVRVRITIIHVSSSQRTAALCPKTLPKGVLQRGFSKISIGTKVIVPCSSFSFFFFACTKTRISVSFFSLCSFFFCFLHIAQQHCVFTRYTPNIVQIMWSCSMKRITSRSPGSKRSGSKKGCSVSPKYRFS